MTHFQARLITTIPPKVFHPAPHFSPFKKNVEIISIVLQLSLFTLSLRRQDPAHFLLGRVLDEHQNSCSFRSPSLFSIQTE